MSMKACQIELKGAMPPIVDGAPPLETIDFEDEQIEAAVTDLKPMCQEERKRTFRWHYDLGKVVALHFNQVRVEREKAGRTMYGEHFFDRLAEEIKVVSGLLLQQCFRLVYAYNEKAFDELCKHPAIKLSHALQLAFVSDAKVRKELQTRVISARPGLDPFVPCHPQCPLARR